ncbi:MAG TPA: riboflavin synthase [Candidatus Lumbricidophila sp.]|nr:riboflavin synthase [Candidatus Lumbricidophila sp.]
MFTGIIEALGAVEAVEQTADAAVLTVAAPGLLHGVRRGDSIAVSGCCLTVVEFDAERFTADVMAQTLRMTTLGSFVPGTPVNLERAALVGDRLGGHIVQGHVDGTGELLEIRPGDAWRVLRFSLPSDLAPLVVDKGSVAVDGVSLTVSDLGDGPDGSWFEVSLIPETLTATTLGGRVVGDRVNLETDILARHVQRMLRLDAHRTLTSSLLASSLQQPGGLE